MQISSEQALEFDTIRLLLARCCATPFGRELAEAVKPTSLIDTISTEHARLSAFRMASDEGLRVEFSAFAEIDTSMLSLPQHKSALEPAQLYTFAAALQEASAQKQLIESVVEGSEAFAPLAPLAEELEIEDWIAAEILSAVDAGGELLDDASPELSRLRAAMRNSRVEINKVLRNFFDPESFPNYVQDEFVTIRGGRLVIPIKIEHRNRYHGIVHDRSRSGDSLFFEPMQAVELNNALAELQGELEIEEARILARLTGLLYDNWEQVSRALLAMAALDLLSAKARLADLYEGSEPVFENSGPLHIREARHPLLDERLSALIRESGISPDEEWPEKVVPIDIKAGGEWKVLVITGPNAGGKTVSLKTAGLMAMMAQAGLQVPASDYRAPVFETISADIGDYQDITSHLSTFSSHLTRLKRLFHKIRTPALVLLDEVASATDPGEGAALAMAVLQQLRDEGAYVIASTHLDAIKAFAHAEEEMQNACVEFDHKTMRPTYKLRYGLPGRSNALETAREIGLPEPVLRRAEALLGNETTQASEIIGKLQEELDALRSERAKLAEEREALAAARKHYVGRLDEAEEKEQKLLRHIEGEWREFRRRYERALAEALDEIKKAESREAAREAAGALRRQLDTDFESLTLLRRRKPESPADDGGPLAEGQEVEIPGFRRRGVVLRPWDPAGGRAVAVEIGGKRITVPRAGVAAMSSGSLRQKKPSGRGGSRARASGRVQVVTDERKPELELKVVGMTVEEALERVERFLDSALLTGTPWVRIIHGHGTGALRRAISAYLKDLPFVSAWGTAEPEAGGEAVTVVEFGE